MKFTTWLSSEIRIESKAGFWHSGYLGASLARTRFLNASLTSNPPRLHTISYSSKGATFLRRSMRPVRESRTQNRLARCPDFNPAMKLPSGEKVGSPIPSLQELSAMMVPSLREAL